VKGWHYPRLRYRFLLALPLVLSASPAQSHDPSAWGGLFRSRDQGATWVSADRRQYLSSAIALAVSPTDSDHLLLGTGGGLFRSRNGGRDWTLEAPSVLLGPVFAAAFASDGRRALLSTSLGIFRSEADSSLQQLPAPRGTAPARAIASSARADCVYLAGWTGLYRSEDLGASWSGATDGLPADTATTLFVAQGSPESLYAVVQGQIWVSADGARSWSRRGTGVLPANIDALTLDSRRPTRQWAMAGDLLFRSDDGGAHWQRVGRPLPELNTKANAIAASEGAVVVTTDRGLFRSTDGGESWTAITDNLPAHLEAGMLVRDPADPATLYAGFSLVPYAELWRRAGSGEGALMRVSITSLAGGAGLLLLLGLGAVAALRWLERYYRQPVHNLQAPPPREAERP
jgi:photosystem II stability/assembly factor-like uncharacterized protein